MTIRNLLAQAAQRWLQPPRLPAASVLSGQPLTIEVVEDQDVRRTHRFDPTRATVQLDAATCTVSVWPDGSAVQRQDAAPCWRFQAASAPAAKQLYQQVQQALRARGSFRRRLGGAAVKLVGAGVAIYVLVVLAGALLGAMTSVAQVSSAPTAASASSTPCGSTGTSVPASVSPDAAKLISSLNGVRLPSSGKGKPYFVFSDPNCPFCQRMEQSIEKVINNQAVILPLGFRQGSRDVAAAVLCAKDQAAEWKKAIEGRSTAKPCDDGYRQVDANMAVFEKLGLAYMPTTVTPAGNMLAGVLEPGELQLALAR
jgi:protein-disulfide isomerase